MTLAYFFRVAPAYARAEIGNVMKEVGEGGRCETGVMPAIAQRRMGPALEKTAISHLSHSEGWVVADAASMLQRHGSARAEAPLWQALDRWHTRWKDRAAKLNGSRQCRWDALGRRERALSDHCAHGRDCVVAERALRSPLDVAVCDQALQGNGRAGIPVFRNEFEHRDLPVRAPAR